MSERRRQIERAFDREAEAIERQYERGDLTADEYHEAMRELERELRDEARGAYEADLEDVRNAWGW